MAIYITGDTHGDFTRLNDIAFPESAEMTREDYVIICGDFGGVWDWDKPSRHEEYWLDWLENRPFTTLFVDGNHECFPRLYEFPLVKWHGGEVHKVRPHILHLIRGSIFEIHQLSFFAFGGARSHDIQGGILSADSSDFKERCRQLDKAGLSYRVNKRNWWEEEMPSPNEMLKGQQVLKEHGNHVDFIITHDCPASTLALFGHGFYQPDDLNFYLEKIRAETKYKKWFFGHYHDNRNVTANDLLIYEQIVRIQ